MASVHFFVVGVLHILEILGKIRGNRIVIEGRILDGISEVFERGRL